MTYGENELHECLGRREHPEVFARHLGDLLSGREMGTALAARIEDERHEAGTLGG